MKYSLDEIAMFILAISCCVFFLVCSYATILIVNAGLVISQQNNAHNVSEIRIR